MRRYWIIFLLFILSIPNISAGQFGNYDFTFYKTVDDSVAIMNNERLGFDYTGYGFLGQNMTTGLYIRFGMQAPYATFKTIFSSSNSESDEDTEEITPIPPIGDNSQGGNLPEIIEPPLAEENPASTTENSPILDTTIMVSDSSSEGSDTPQEEVIVTDYAREFIFSFTIGPSFRHFISDSVMWYMGMGISSIIKDITRNSSNPNGIIKSFEMKIGTDLDMGFRIDLKDNASLRIGVHSTSDLLTYTSTTVTEKGDKKPTVTNNIVADLFVPIGEDSTTEVKGYIGLAHVLKPKDIIRYRYSNKTPKLGAGTLTIIE